MLQPFESLASSRHLSMPRWNPQKWFGAVQALALRWLRQKRASSKQLNQH